jgi:phage portal protein BeeE
MRSMAPGGWSDDRWAETKAWTGITYIAGHRICEQLSQSEFKIYRRDDNHPDGKKLVSRRDPSYELHELLERPNNDDSWGDLAYNWGMQLTLTGKALTWMVPNELRKPMELYPIPTAIAIPQPAVNPDYPDGCYRIQPVYPYGPFSSYPTPTSAVGAPIPAQWMLEFKYPHPLLRYDGYSPLTALNFHFDEVLMIDKSRHYSMRRAINPSAVLNMEGMEGAQPLPESEIERIKAEFENSFFGPENAGQLYVAAPGSRLELFGQTPKDMDYSNGWDQLVSFLLGGLGITKPAAGMVDDSSYSTLFATLKQLYWLTLEPMINRIGNKLTRHLAPFYGEDLIVEIKCRRIDDHDVRNGEIQQGLATRCITKNEVRKMLGLPPTKEQWGNEIAGVEPLPPMPQEMPPQGSGMPQGQMQGGEANPQDILAMLAANGQLGNLDEQGNPMQDEVRGEPVEVGNSRPRTGKLAAGGLGPRMKSISPGEIREIIRERNGDLRKLRKSFDPEKPFKTMYQKISEALIKSGVS